MKRLERVAGDVRRRHAGSAVQLVNGFDFRQLSATREPQR